MLTQCTGKGPRLWLVVLGLIHTQVTNLRNMHSPPLLCILPSHLSAVVGISSQSLKMRGHPRAHYSRPGPPLAAPVPVSWESPGPGSVRSGSSQYSLSSFPGGQSVL